MWFITTAPRESKIPPSAYNEGEKNMKPWNVLLDRVNAIILKLISDVSVIIRDLKLLVLEWNAKRAKPTNRKASHLSSVNGEAL
jgi:hypothetical protein